MKLELQDTVTAPPGLDEDGLAHLRNEYENLLRQFLFLNELVSLLFSSMKTEEVMRKIVEGIHRMLDIDRVGILLIDAEGGDLACVHATGIEKNLLEKFKIPIRECKEVLIKAAVSKSPFLPNEEAAILKRMICNSLCESEADSLVFPLFSYRGSGCLQNWSDDFLRESSDRNPQKKHTNSGEEFSIGEECIQCSYFPILGIIWMDNKMSGRRFNHELVTLYTLVLNMNVALENKILIKQLRDVSIKDSLTGAFNRTYLYSIIEKEVERAQRQASHLTIAMVDLDNFKQINDTYGHQFGDRYLQEFSQFIQRSIRKMDHFCRYGGDEFVIIFPGATAEQAAQAIRRLIGRRQSEGSDSLKMLISAGIASYPESTRETKEIIELADRALYTAKRKGRGLIEIFHPP